jgi:CO/xanthine dehydrogenase Mo-binding subunit
MNAPFAMNRRRFLQTTGFLTLSFAIPPELSFAQQAAAPAEGPKLPGDLKNNPMLSAWLRINSDETVTLMIGKVELGQGAVTALAQVCADELGVNMERLEVISGDTAVGPDQGTTAGSQSMPNGATALRQAAAECREILYGLAAAKLGQPAAGMKVDDGVVTAADGKTATYWELVSGKEFEKEATGVATFRPASDYKYIGKSVPRLDIPAKMTGGEAFVQEMHPQGVVYGKIVRPPTYKAKLTDVDLSVAESIAGVIKVVRDGSFLGVVSEREDQAFAAVAALEKAAKWEVEKALPGNDGMEEWLTTKAPIAKEIETFTKAREGGPDPVKTIEASYYRPYHMHGSIGTSAAVAELGDDGVMTVHTHSQSVFETRDAIAEMLGMEPAKVRLIHAQGSGCYGHNNADDAAADAALLARAVPGKPVKLQYTRAQEHQWEPYGSAMALKVTAGVDADGNVIDWDHQIWSTPHGTRPSGKAGNLLSARYLEKPFEQPVPGNGGGPNFSADRNSIPLYEFPGTTVRLHFITEQPLRVSSTRGLGAYANVFAIESFIDELAHAAGADPVEYRLRFLKNERGREILQAAADKFGWGSYEKKEGRGRGIAFAQYKSKSGAFTAVALEVEVSKRNGRVRVLRVAAADDSGTIVSPDGVTNQVEGGIIQSLSWTLKEEVKFDDTQVLSRDWASYPILTFSEVPPIETVLIDRPGQPFLGTGECSQGPTGAAVANAIFDATGVRYRRLPFTPDRIKAGLAT